MSRAATSQLVAVAITALFIGFVVMRRMRPQPARSGEGAARCSR
jgi:hypothetical protein